MDRYLFLMSLDLQRERAREAERRRLASVDPDRESDLEAIAHAIGHGLTKVGHAITSVVRRLNDTVADEEHPLVTLR